VSKELQQLREKPFRLVCIALAVVGLALSFLLQDVDLLQRAGVYASPSTHFVVRKLIRVIINDTCLLIIIHFWFYDPSVTQLSWKIQLVDTLILLPIYLVLKLNLEGPSEISAPLLSQFHRIIVNPTLMILIIPGVYFQRIRTKN
jgi:exosortase F-associated protein